MARAKKSTSKKRPPYLTKRVLMRAARSGFRKAADETMTVMGYNVIVQDGWVVKIFPDGRVERLKQLPALENTPFFLD